MQLIFGVACDGRVYLDFPGDRDGALGQAVVGLTGLTEILETHLGLTGPKTGEAVRIATYAAKLNASMSGAPQRFFAASFRRDPWATAKTLLGWRDDLISSGWSSEPLKSERLDDLADVEGVGPALASGLSDRLQTLLQVLANRPALGVRSIALVEPRPLLPPPCQALIEAVEQCGVEILSTTGQTNSGTSDLSNAQAFLGGQKSDPLIGDGTFVSLGADTALLAAEALAEWLAAGSEDDLAGTVIISPDGDTALLDQTLQARGLPALGQSAASPWRGALQVLPLAFATVWKPFNPRALLDLLMLPRPPISRSAARRLANAIAREPGQGGAQWTTAWARIEAELAERLIEHPNAEAEVEKRLSRWREWTTGGLYDRTVGIPAAKARQIAHRVGQWATETDGGANDPLLLSVSGAANALADAIDVLALDTLPSLLIERILEQVLSDGAQNPDHIATAGGLRCVRDPAAIWAPAARVVWWDFKGPGDRVPTPIWSRAELEALESAGCHLEAPAACSARIGWSYANAVHMAREQLILVRPALSGSEETISHPLAHQLDPITRHAGARVHWSAEQLLENASVSLAGRRIEREKVAVIAQPSPQALWTLPVSAIAKFEGRKESATSFERLLDCQMRWILLDVLRLSRGRFAEIPGADQLLGNLAHEIANRVLTAGPVADGDDILRKVDDVFEGLVDALAASLRQPELAGELAVARARLPIALKHLANVLREKGLEVIGTEVDRAAEFHGGLSVVGRLDLVVRHPVHGTGVIDLKWTRSAKRRRSEIEEGRAFQLATYGAIADPEATAPSPGAYYLLNQRRLIGPRGSMVADEQVDPKRALSDTWEDIRTTWETWRGLALSGSAVATGMPDASASIPGDLVVIPSDKPCQYCELTSLCRVRGEVVSG
jgi:ATP-dependent helicase/nuclease subunit B